MPAFDESCVLIPTSTLEDFPSGGNSQDAANLLAAWTVPWHPALIAACGCPNWYRADGLPGPGSNSATSPDAEPAGKTGRRLFVIPDQCRDLVDRDWLGRLVPVEEMASGTADGLADSAVRDARLSGPDRPAMLAKLFVGAKGNELGERWPRTPDRLRDGSREIGPEDFFALAYAALQIQIMTRRLRYSSNLDEIRLHQHAAAAATAFAQSRAADAIGALHEAFDLLAEERDHYFASDPGLVDLTLTTPGTLKSLDPDHFATAVDRPGKGYGGEHPLAGTTDDAGGETRHPMRSDDAYVLPTPANVLIDQVTCQAITANRSRERDGDDRPANHGDHEIEWLCEAIRQRRIGWAGGGPSEACFDELTFEQSVATLRQAHNAAAAALGVPPAVYARFSGSTPADLMGTLAELGYQGVIPIDFARGTGHADEAKVIMTADGAELEALVAKPIDASDDVAFLNLAAKLGRSIDSGEIATALLVHWPGRVCASFNDLRRAASWTLALGKFWRLSDYFTDGEHPYHHGSPRWLCREAEERLADQVRDRSADPISMAARRFNEAVMRESTAALGNLKALASGEVNPDDSAAGGDATDLDRHAASLAAAVGCELADDDPPDAVAMINPHAVGVRRPTVLSESPRSTASRVYGSSPIRRGEGTAVATSIDVPAHGFTVVSGHPGAGESGGLFSADGWLRRKLLGGSTILTDNMLVNRFLEAKILETTGGIGGVFSGQGRGNRYSMRLVHVAEGFDAADGQMRCDQHSVLRNDADAATVRVAGKLLRADQRMVADFEMNYTLHRGSRWLCVEGTLNPHQPPSGDPWSNYFAVRSAVATDAAITRVMVRDKLHRSSRRRMVGPLGLQVDETERTTLIVPHGYPHHRRVGDRFIDTLLICAGESQQAFRLHIGFDVKSPIAAAKSILSSPRSIAVRREAEDRDGWIVHQSPGSVDVTVTDVFHRDDHRLAAKVRLIQTESGSVKCSVRFCRDVRAACRYDADVSNHADLDSLPKSIPSQGDRIRLSLSGHSVTEILVIFASIATTAGGERSDTETEVTPAQQSDRD